MYAHYSHYINNLEANHSANEMTVPPFVVSRPNTAAKTQEGNGFLLHDKFKLELLLPPRQCVGRSVLHFLYSTPHLT